MALFDQCGDCSCGSTPSAQYRTVTLNRACLTINNFNFYVFGQDGTLPAPSTANTIIPFCGGPQYLTNTESLSQPDGTGGPGDYWSGYRANHDMPPGGTSTITQGTNILTTSWDDYTWDVDSNSPYQIGPSNFTGFPSGSR